MPRYDGTGPAGRGPGTGWGMGPCGGGMGYGRRGGGRFGGYAPTTPTAEKEVLEQELKDIKARLDQLKSQK